MHLIEADDPNFLGVFETDEKTWCIKYMCCVQMQFSHSVNFLADTYRQVRYFSLLLPRALWMYIL